MWNPVTIAAITAAAVAIGGVALAIIKQLQHQADPAAHAPAAGAAYRATARGTGTWGAGADRAPAPVIADPWPPSASSSPPTVPDVTGLTNGIDPTGLIGGADPGKPAGIEDD